MSGRRVRKSVVLEPLSGDQMAGRQVLTVVVNLVVAPDGRLLYGTVIDVQEGVHGRFQDWAGLADAAADWLASRIGRDRSDDPDGQQA